MALSDRDSFLALLEKLGAEDDAEALAAAREATERLKAENLTWNDVLAIEAPDADDAFHDEGGWDGETDDAIGDAPADAEPSEDGEAPAAAPGDDKALIQALLARKDLGEALREELRGYATDLQEGDFTPADSRYLRALAARLDRPVKTRKTKG